MTISTRLAGYINLIIVLFFGCGALGAATMIPERTRSALVQVVETFRIVSVGLLWTIGVTAIVALAGGLVLLVYLGLQYARFSRGRADLREAEVLAARRTARLLVTTAPAGDQVYIHEVDPSDNNLIHRPLHLTPGRLNGDPAIPHPDEIRRWAFYQAVHAPRVTAGTPAGGEPPLLAAGAPPELLAELDGVQRCLIVGPSDAGKTTLLQHIQSRRLNNSRVVAIDPHAWPGKWVAHKTFGTGRNYQEIDWGLQELLRLMIRRYDDIGAGRIAEGNHAKLTIVIDEWRTIIRNVTDAGDAIKTILTESRKAAFSVFLATHTERVRPLGIEGEGDLKDGFVIVRLALVDGRHTATLDRGNGEIPVALPGPFSRVVQSPRQLDEGDDTAPLLADNTDHVPGPDSANDRLIVAMAGNGHSKKEICAALGWTPGGKQYQKIDQVLARFGRE